MSILKWSLFVMALNFVVGCSEPETSKLAAFMDINQLFSDPSLNKIAMAAEEGKTQELEEAAESGLDIDARGSLEVTPLYWALRKNRLDSFRKLLELGANPNVQFDDGGSIIRWAVRNPNSEFLKLALDYGANPNQRSIIGNETPLFQSLDFRSRYGELAAMRLLLSYGADPNAQNKRGVPMVLIAANSKRFDAVYELLNAGANPELEDNLGYSFNDYIDQNEEFVFEDHLVNVWFRKCVESIKKQLKGSEPI